MPVLNLDNLLLVEISKKSIKPLMKLNTKCRIPIQIIKYDSNPLPLRKLAMISEDFWEAIKDITAKETTIVDDDMTEKGALRVIGADKKTIIWTTSKEAMTVMSNLSPGEHILHIS